MAEGPVNFGKPVGILVLLGCIGGGAYLYMNRPSVYEQREGPNSYWTVNWPHDWETRPAGDPENATRVLSSGPLSEEVMGQGWAIAIVHGTITWPTMVVEKIGTTPDKIIEDKFIDNKKCVIYEYEDNVTRFMGCAVERGDVLVYVNIGCPKANFEQFRPKLEKCIMSVRCVR
ncbi:MAG TPA: hypothetical protein VNM14_21565 [Planctomycetota bacterium]|jgi:hypothetical protein|nr:hypothetical protein [Planctomycetota bacterium]